MFIPLQLYLETVEFVEHDDAHCLAQQPAIRQDLLTYTQSLRHALVSLWSQMNELSVSAEKRAMLNASMSKLCKQIEPPSSETNRHSEDSSIWAQLLTDLKDEKEMESIVQLVEDRAWKLAEDRLYSCALMQRSFKTLLDIMAETTGGHLVKLVALAPQDMHAINKVCLQASISCKVIYNERLIHVCE